MKIIKEVKLLDISKEYSVRSDLNFIKYVEDKNKEKFISFEKIFNVIENKNINIDELEEFKYCQIGDVDGEGALTPVIINFDEQTAELADYYKKIKKGDIFKPQKGDILVSKIRPYLKKIVFIDESNEDVYFTKAFICLKPKLNPILTFFLLRCLWFKDLNSISRIGKGYPTLNVNDFKYLRIEEDSIEKINSIENLKDIMNKLKLCLSNIQKRKDIISDKNIINNVFSKYFNYDKNIIFKLHKGMTYGTQIDGLTEKSIENINFSSIKNNNYRFSTRINNRIFNEVYQKILDIPHIKIDNIYKQLEKGVQPEYCDDGIKVIKIANLKNKNIDYENVEYASEIYCKKLSDDKFLKTDDIIICCTGKGSLGKIDVVENDEIAITSVDNYILRIDKSKYNVKFLTYYLRSIFGIVQFEMNYTGMTNQIHFYEDNIRNIIIPDIDLKEQEKIEREIEKEIKIRDDKEEQKQVEKEKVLNLLESIMKKD